MYNYQPKHEWHIISALKYLGVGNEKYKRRKSVTTIREAHEETYSSFVLLFCYYYFILLSPYII